MTIEQFNKLCHICVTAQSAKKYEVSNALCAHMLFDFFSDQWEDARKTDKGSPVALTYASDCDFHDITQLYYDLIQIETRWSAACIPVPLLSQKYVIGILKGCAGVEDRGMVRAWQAEYPGWTYSHDDLWEEVGRIVKPEDLLASVLQVLWHGGLKSAEAVVKAYNINVVDFFSQRNNYKLLWLQLPEEMFGTTQTEILRAVNALSQQHE